MTLLQALIVGAASGLAIGIAIGALRARRARAEERSTLDREPR